MTPAASPAVAVLAVLTGRTAPLGHTLSAIAKRPVSGPVFLGKCGLAEDQQADGRVHGGPEKALHHYALEHYGTWQRWSTGLSPLPIPGAFGENLSTLGMTEADVCVGDIYRLGGSVIQVSQPRQPCWKLNLRFGIPDFARLVQDSGWTGWYYRVLEEGEIAAGDSIALLERPNASWPLRRLLAAWYQNPLDVPSLHAIAGLSGLTDRWRLAARRRLESGLVEDWGARLDTPLPGKPT